MAYSPVYDSNNNITGYNTDSGFKSTTAPAAAPATPSPYYPRYSEPTTIAAPAPQSQEEIQATKMKAAQAEIDNLNSYYADLTRQQQTTNEKNDRSTAAISTLTGLAGSTEADAQQKSTSAQGQQALEKVQHEKALAISQILTKIRTDAVTEARQQRLDYNQNVTDSIANRKSQIEIQAADKADATNSLSVLAKQGNATLEGIKATLSPSEYQHLITKAGGEPMAKAILFDSRPKNSIIGTPSIVGSHVVQYFQTPEGKIISENVPLPEGVDANGIQSVEKTDNGIFIIKKDGTWTKVTGSAKPVVGTGGNTAGTPPNPTATPDAQQRLNEALTLAKELKNDTSYAKRGAVGFGYQKFVPFGESLGLQPGRAAFDAKLNTLKANLTLDNLKLLKGAMSDKDLLFLNSVGSSLDTNMSEAAFDKELERIVTKLESATGNTSSEKIISAPDGTPVEIID